MKKLMQSIRDLISLIARVYVDADVEKSHGITFEFGGTLRGIAIGLQWRSYDARDDGEDPWMLVARISYWRQRRRLLYHKSKSVYLMNPRTEIPAVTRLSLAMRGRKYWCDDYGAKESIWMYQYRNQHRKQG